MTKPTFTHEQSLWEEGYKHIAGVDEVGRGCFAGPVVAAAVILPPDFDATDEINDSKLLTAQKRDQLSEIIKQHAISYSIAEIPVDIINKAGIGKATQKAFYQAIQSLHVPPDYILIDAFYIDRLNRKNQKPIVHGDGISITIASASILAKVHRDARMCQLHTLFPQYDFLQNKGYGTKKHREAIKKYGLSDLHRASFNLSKFL